MPSQQALIVIMLLTRKGRLVGIFAFVLIVLVIVEDPLFVPRRLRLEKWDAKGIPFYNRTGRVDEHPFSRGGFGINRCNQAGVNWYPSREDRWQINTPNFLIAGSPRSGTTALSTLLSQHPRVRKPKVKELNYFRRLPIEDNLTISVKAARDFLYSQDGFPVDLLKEHPKLVTYDATPSYLYWSRPILPQILCVCPWVKVIVLIRDPVERFDSSYWYDYARHGDKLRSMERVVQEELWVMQEVAGLSPSLPAGSEQESEAWNKYQGLSTKGWLGKGLYDLQIRRLREAFGFYGKSLTEDLLMLRFRDLHQGNLNSTYTRVLRFLDLPQTPTPDWYNQNEASARERIPLDPTVRKQLEDFYRPYNQRFNELMGEKWLSEYDNSDEADETTTTTSHATIA